MTPEQEKHLATIKGLVDFRLDTKYRRGQKEHGGDLFSKNSLWLVDAAIDEAIDQIVYLLTLKDKIIEESNLASSDFNIYIL